jgi:hypothetical protein
MICQRVLHQHRQTDRGPPTCAWCDGPGLAQAHPVGIERPQGGGEVCLSSQLLGEPEVPYARQSEVPYEGHPWQSASAAVWHSLSQPLADCVTQSCAGTGSPSTATHEPQVTR